MPEIPGKLFLIEFGRPNKLLTEVDVFHKEAIKQ